MLRPLSTRARQRPYTEDDLPTPDLIAKLVTDPPPAGMHRLEANLAADAALRERFLTRPGEVLEAYGVRTATKIELGDRERALIRVFLDPEVTRLYAAGKLDRLREHIIARHPEVGLARPTDLASAIAFVDVDVAVVAEATAVAVAVVAIAVTGAFADRRRIPSAEAVMADLKARLDVLEGRAGRLAVLENRLAALEARID